MKGENHLSLRVRLTMIAIKTPIILITALLLAYGPRLVGSDWSIVSEGYETRFVIVWSLAVVLWTEFGVLIVELVKKWRRDGYGSR